MLLWTGVELGPTVTWAEKAPVEQLLGLCEKTTGNDWPDRSLSWQSAALSTVPVTITTPPPEGRLPGVALADTTTGTGAGTVLAAALACPASPSTADAAATTGRPQNPRPLELAFHLNTITGTRATGDSSRIS